MRSAPFLLAGALLLGSCKPRNPEAATPAEKEQSQPGLLTGSRELAANFPLLPMIEKSTWSQLLDAEARQVASDPSVRESADKEVAGLTDKLRRRHPFKAEGKRLELGGIVCDKSQGRFSLPARVRYPDPGDERHPGELELLLCTEGGRTHETLFVTDARPLHLELLLHLAGRAKEPQASRFRIDVLTSAGERIPVESLIHAKSGETLESPLCWEFSGSDFKDIYSPDLSGDFVILWHAHDSVLRVDHEGIASGVVKLDAVPHPKLKNGDPVVLEMIALQQ